jgi:Zn-dependent protease
MKTKSGTKIGEPFGIGVYIHWSFWLLLGYFALKYLATGGILGALNGVALVIGVFGCVVLHELGHSLTARYFGIGTRDITLYPIGGVAALERMPRNPKQEMLIAIAGPLVNVVIAAVLGFLLASGFQDRLLPTLLYTNIALVAFNLIPAFPMDGGRVFRAGLSLIMPRVRATNIAANTGKVVAILMALVGIFSNPMLIFIGIFIFIAAGSEQRMVIEEEEFSGMYATPTSPPPPFPFRFSEAEPEREIIDPQILPPERFERHGAMRF